MRRAKGEREEGVLVSANEKLEDNQSDKKTCAPASNPVISNVLKTDGGEIAELGLSSFG